jgi:hypothetical protein
VPDRLVVERYERLLSEYHQSAARLVDALQAMAIARVRDALPSAHRLELAGEMSENGVPTLRVLRVLGPDAGVLFDALDPRRDPRVEDVIDVVGVDHLDLLRDLTGDQYVGRQVVEW